MSARVLVFAVRTPTTRCSMGGTIALHAVERATLIRIVCVTDGSSTQYPGDAGKRAQKEDEARRAAAELGVEDYVHLDMPDMRLDTLAHVEVNAVVEEHVREFGPDVDHTPQPDVNHDHRALFDSVAGRDASRAGSDRAQAAHVCADVQHRNGRRRL